MDDLESFHFEIRIELPTPTSGSQDDQVFPPITMVGDFQVPDRIRLASSGFLEMETIAIGRTQYRRVPGLPWGAEELDEDDQPSMTPRIWTVLAPLQSEHLEYLGEVTLDGMQTHRLRGRFSGVSFSDQEEGEVTLEVWIGVEDGFWRQAQTEVEPESTDGTVTSVFEFSAFGAPVAIEHPDEWWPMLRDLRWTPSEPVPAVPFTILFLAENHGGVLLNTTIEVAVDNETIRTFSVTDLAPGAARAINFELTLEAGFHNLQVGGNNVVIAVFEESDPRKRLSRSAGSDSPLSLSSRSVLPGQPVTITYTLEAGDALTDPEVELSINGQILRTFVFSEMPPGSSQTITLEVIRSEPGEYQVEASWHSELSSGGGSGGSSASTFEVIGSPPPGFRLSVHQGAEQIGGEDPSLPDVLALGKPVVLNFWAGLCPPCRAEMPSFQRIYEENKEDFILLGIDVGPFTGLGTNEDGVRFLEQLGITYPTASVPDDQMVRDYRVVAMPTTLFINADGTILHRWAGALNETTMEELVHELIGLSSASTVGEPTSTLTTKRAAQGVFDAAPTLAPIRQAQPVHAVPAPTPTSAAQAVPAVPAPTPAPAASPARECFDVRSELDSLEVMRVDPELGTVLGVGATVTVVAEVRYRVDFDGGGYVTLDRSEGTQSVATADVPAGEGTITLEGAFEVPDISEVSITMWMHPPASAAYAAGYDCWSVLVFKTVGVYPTDLASE